MNLYFCCVWLDVSGKSECTVYGLPRDGLLYWSLHGWLTGIKRFLQHCLQVARRSVRKYITAWSYSEEQILLLGFIKSSPPNKQYLSSTSSIDSPQEAVPVAAASKSCVSKHIFYTVWTWFIYSITWRVEYSWSSSLLSVVEGKLVRRI